jgi:hypothetical protein
LSKNSSEAGLTAKQREWLRHIRTCHRSGESAKTYAARHKLSVHGLYQATKDLRKLGVLPPAKRSANEAKTDSTGDASPSRFVPVRAVRDTGATGFVRFPSGAIFASRGSLSGPEVQLVIEMLSRQP